MTSLSLINTIVHTEKYSNGFLICTFMSNETFHPQNAYFVAKNTISFKFLLLWSPYARPAKLATWNVILLVVFIMTKTIYSTIFFLVIWVHIYWQILTISRLLSEGILFGVFRSRNRPSDILLTLGRRAREQAR